MNVITKLRKLQNGITKIPKKVKGVFFCLQKANFLCSTKSFLIFGAHNTNFHMNWSLMKKLAH